MKLGILPIALICIGTLSACATTSQSEVDDTPDVLRRHNMRWIETCIQRWPVRSTYVQGNQENGVLVWYARNGEEVARLRRRDGHPWEGVIFGGAREDAADPRTQPPHRLVDVFADGKIVGYAIFDRNKEGTWRLADGWTYNGT